MINPHQIFRLPDRRQSLWDSSSNDEEDNYQSNIEMIDLTTRSSEDELPPPSLPQISQPSIEQQQQQQQIIAPYVPRTLQQNSRRHSILPAFPTSFYNEKPPLLLANVPAHKLNQEQLARRQQGLYPLPYIINDKTFDIPSYFRTTYQSFITSLINQYNIDESIIDYNLNRCFECYRIFADDYIRRHKYPTQMFELDEKQKKYAFEFYLQIDVDLFYMKTCTFRGAQLRSIGEGLFCINEPEAKYGLLPCNNCRLCLPSSSYISRRQQPLIQFNPSHKFRFLNGYQTILNCSADCQTQNIIYVMTCPCNEFEFIGGTSQRLSSRLWHHRQHFNRIIHEFLIGEGNVKLTQSQEKNQETLNKDRMLLYRHAARCPSAMQIFLNFNPDYWCFVPVTLNEAVQQNRNYILPSSLILLDSINPTSIGSKNRPDIPATADTRSDEATRSYMRRIPPIPSGYTYSIRQRIQQFQYFKNKHDTIQKQDDSTDIFNVSIIAVLPLDAADAVRRFVVSLFVTHTEAKLNTQDQLLRHQNDDNSNDINVNINNIASEDRIVDRGDWCRNLIFRFHK